MNPLPQEGDVLMRNLGFNKRANKLIEMLNNSWNFKVQFNDFYLAGQGNPTRK